MAIKPIDEAAEVKKLLNEDLGAGGFYQDYISRLSDQITKEFKEGITKNVRSKSGSLASSVESIPTKGGFEIRADVYYDFIDEGVQGYTPPGLKPVSGIIKNGTYKFKSLKVHRDFISNMKQYAGNDLSGQFALAISIKRKGIKAKNITDQVITDELLEMIAEDLATLTGLAFGVVFDRNTKDAIE